MDVRISGSSLFVRTAGLPSPASDHRYQPQPQHPVRSFKISPPSRQHIHYNVADYVVFSTDVHIYVVQNKSEILK